MATKLNVDTGGLDIGKKLWERHQKDEYTHVDNYKEAIKYFNLARNYEPNNPDIYYNIGRSYEKTGNKTKAKEYFEKALKLSPEHELSKKGLNRL